MESNLFWFSDAQWEKIVPHLPTNQPGPERKDDRRVLSGIMDCPKDYGPHKTIYNRGIMVQTPQEIKPLCP